MENYNKDIFESIRKTYEIARESERKRIIDYIAKQKDEKGKPLFTFCCFGSSFLRQSRTYLVQNSPSVRRKGKTP